MRRTRDKLLRKKAIRNQPDIAQWFVAFQLLQKGAGSRLVSGYQGLAPPTPKRKRGLIKNNKKANWAWCEHIA